MKDKTLDCLKYAAMPFDAKRYEFFSAMTTKYSEKAIERKLEELKRRGQITLGPDGYVLTEPGRIFLDSFLFTLQTSIDYMNFMAIQPPANV